MTMIYSTDQLLHGIPAGQLSCIAAVRSDDGPKSGIASHLIQQAILRGEKVLFINMESSIDDAHFKQLGLDNK